MRRASAAVRIRSTLVAIVCGLASACAVAAGDDDRLRNERLEDFDAFCRFVGDDYAYFDLKKTDWPAACAAHRPAAAEATGRAMMIGVVESTLAELYDPHAHLGTSTRQSPRLVPTDADLYAEWRGDDATIVSVRAGSAARDVGLRAGMRVVEVDGRPVAGAVAATMPAHLKSPDIAARDWALRAVLAGHQDGEPVRIVVVTDEGRQAFAFVPDRRRVPALLSTRRIDRVGVIRIHNALGDTALIAAFDDALASLKDIDALVLDLRDTPSGGNTAVARGIIGRLVTREAPFQRHERVGEARETGVRHVWVEYVEPRGEPFTKPVVVLVGRWTGSMGEGIAIGLDAARHAPVLGAPMAHLLGALDAFTLPHAGFAVRIPAERLLHVDGTPREAFVPCAIVVGDDAGELVQAAGVARSLTADEAAFRCGGP